MPLSYTKEAFEKFVIGDADTWEEEDLVKVREMMAQAEAVANPKAMCRIAEITDRSESYVEIEGERIKSELVIRNLENTHRVFPYVATCGTELEEWSLAFTDIMEEYWADRIKLFFLGQISARLQEKVRNTYFPAGHMSSMNPGSLAAWPISEQAVLFRIAGNVTEETGVRLTKSFLMLPSKSTSGFFFSSKEAYENCQFCPILDCPNRRARYAGKPVV